MQARHRRSGLTLIEALLGASLVAISFTAFFSLQAAIMRSNEDARRRSECIALAESQMAALQRAPWCPGEVPGMYGQFPDLTDRGPDLGETDPEAYQWVPLEHGINLAGMTDQEPDPLNVNGDFAGTDGTDPTTTRFRGPARYYLSYDVFMAPEVDDLLMKVMVKCQYQKPSRDDDAPDFFDPDMWDGVQVMSLRVGSPTLDGAPCDE